MNKLVILTTSIIRGNFHCESIGKFYDFFYKYLEKYDIYHIINIDEPKNLKKFFNKYETMYYYNKIIPYKVNKIFINDTIPGFLQAYKKIISKIEELNLIGDKYLYYWLEDDWEPKFNVDFTKFFDLLNFNNSAYTYTDKTPLGSFRGGPFMTGTYFNNIFNIKKYMNDTCDPERQMQRWLRGTNQKNGNSYIHRFSISNKNVENYCIHIIIVCEDTNINISELNIHHYKCSFDKTIQFNYHLITYDIQYNLKYSICKDNKYNLVLTSYNDLKNIFDNNTIKYFIIKPAVMFDIGRNFNKTFGLEKWNKIEDSTEYYDIQFYNTYLGNNLQLVDDELRLKPKYTMNDNFINTFKNIIYSLPYLEEKYYSKNINLNILYYSHIYGEYPNFQVIGGEYIQLNYTPSINITNQQFDELNSLVNLKNKLYGNGILNNIEFEKKYLEKYFKFNPLIINEVNKYIEIFNNKKVLGLYDNHKNPISNIYNESKYDIDETNIDKFINLIDVHLTTNYYDSIFIYKNNELLKKLNNKYQYKYEIMYWNNSYNNCYNLNRFNVIKNKIDIIIQNENNITERVKLENELKYETKINKNLLYNEIINYLILLNCDNIIFSS